MSKAIKESLAQSTLPQAMASAVANHPEKLWLKSGETNLTFAEADLLSNRFANALAGLGVKDQDVVLAMMPDTIEFVLLWASLSKVGAVEVPVNSAYKGDLLTHVINDSRAQLIVCHEMFLPRLMEVESQLKDLKEIVLVGSADSLSALTPEQYARFTFHSFADFYQAEESPLTCASAGSDMMSIVYTSGTTGPSKGVMTTQRHAYRYACSIIEALEMEHEDVVYTCGMPLFHVAAKWGAGYASLIKGTTLAIPEKFSLSGFWAEVARYQATISILPGVVASLLYSQEPSEAEKNSTLKKACMVPLIPEFEEFKRRFGMRISMAYGSTECGCPTIHSMDEPVTDRRSIGKLKSDLYEMAIVDEQDVEVPTGEIGEIVVRSKEPSIMMMGYWHRPEATANAWRNLWFHSGDAGFKDEDGNFYFVDRQKDCIRRRGENVSSSEVEGIVSQHPSILECAVYPVPSELTEDEIMVAIVLKPDMSLDEAELIDYLGDKMPYFMVPRFVEFVDVLPKTETGKVKKKELTDRGVTDASWDCVAAGIKLKR
jgi:carnitine-CoA ligase